MMFLKFHSVKAKNIDQGHINPRNKKYYFHNKLEYNRLSHCRRRKTHYSPHKFCCYL